MKRISVVLFIFILAGATGFTLVSCKKSTEHAGAHGQQAKFHCPMHPTYVSDKPGDCPICGMRLVPIESEEQHESAVKASGGERKILFYRHPMQPGVTSPVPKKDEMGMDYVPVYSDEANAANPVDGYANVKISANREQLIGVRTAPVQKQDLSILIRASGRVAYDPDLYSAIAEYKQAVTAQEKTKNSPWPDVQSQAASLVRSSALRLRQMGLADDQIANITDAQANDTSLLLGQPGGSVWVYAQIYEYESGLVRPGQPMEVVSTAFPGRRYWGKVKAVDSIVNSETRSLRVRAEVPNLEGNLKPDMYVDAIIHVELGRRLAIPEEAIMDTGTRMITFVVTAPGQYEPREVRVGHEADGFYEVISGVKDGEQVVASANFLIDSESRLKAALSGAGAGSGHKHGQ